MNVIPVCVELLLVSNQMFPVTRLPNAALTMAAAVTGNLDIVTAGRQKLLRKPPFEM